MWPRAARPPSAEAGARSGCLLPRLRRRRLVGSAFDHQGTVEAVRQAWREVQFEGRVTLRRKRQGRPLPVAGRHDGARNLLVADGAIAPYRMLTIRPSMVTTTSASGLSSSDSRYRSPSGPFSSIEGIVPATTSSMVTAPRPPAGEVLQATSSSPANATEGAVRTAEASRERAVDFMAGSGADGGGPCPRSVHVSLFTRTVHGSRATVWVQDRGGHQHDQNHPRAVLAALATLSLTGCIETGGGQEGRPGVTDGRHRGHAPADQPEGSCPADGQRSIRGAERRQRGPARGWHPAPGLAGRTLQTDLEASQLAPGEVRRCWSRTPRRMRRMRPSPSSCPMTPSRRRSSYDSTERSGRSSPSSLR